LAFGVLNEPYMPNNTIARVLQLREEISQCAPVMQCAKRVTFVDAFVYDACIPSNAKAIAILHNDCNKRNADID